MPRPKFAVHQIDDSGDVKICSRCHRLLSTKNFSPNGKRLRSSCRECTAAMVDKSKRVEYYEKNRDKFSESARKWRECNYEHFRKYVSEWKLRNFERVSAYNHEYYLRFRRFRLQSNFSKKDDRTFEDIIKDPNGVDPECDISAYGLRCWLEENIDPNDLSILDAFMDNDFDPNCTSQDVGVSPECVMATILRIRHVVEERDLDGLFSFALNTNKGRGVF